MMIKPKHGSKAAFKLLLTARSEKREAASIMTYLQVKAEHVLIISALVAVWGTFVVAQGVALVIYPLYRTVYSPS